jgi:hypothetical protein
MLVKQIQKYSLKEGMHLVTKEGTSIFELGEHPERIFKIENGELKINQRYQDLYGLSDNDGLRALVLLAFSMIEWEEEYIIMEDSVEHTIFVGRDIDEEDYYVVKVRSGSMYKICSDGNGNEFSEIIEQPFLKAINDCNGDLEHNKNYLFNRLERLQNIIRESTMRFKRKPQFVNYDIVE